MVIIFGYAIDCAEVEEHNVDNEVTEHPVEKGADVADHVRARPIAVTIEGVVTDTPIGAMVALRNDSPKPSNDARAHLVKIRDDREPGTLETTLGTYQNMVLEQLQFPRSVDDGDSLRFRATFKQVELVTNDRATIRVSVPRAAKKVNLGNKPTEPAPAFAPSSTQVTTPKQPQPVVNPRRQPIRTSRRVPVASGGSETVPSGRVEVQPGGILRGST